MRSYGRRRGRKASPRQQSLAEDLLPRLQVPLDTPPPEPLAALGGAGCREVWLEIGFGGGEHLIWQAEKNPHVLMIGCEPFMDGVAKVLDAVATRNIANIRLHADDARAVLRWLQPELDRPRVRAVSGPVAQSETPQAQVGQFRDDRRTWPGRCARVAELRLGTDIGDYAAQMLEVVLASGAFDWQANRPADWRERPEDWPSTRYEEKGIREGRRCAYLRFVRSAASD